MTEQDRQNRFSELIAQHYSQLFAYIFAVVKNRDDAEDVFQSVCLVLWRRFDSFQPNSSFFSWGRQTAKLVLCSFLRHKRNLSNKASEALLDAVARAASNTQEEEVEVYLNALQRCKEKLSDADDELLQLRYVDGLVIREIADRLQRHQPHVCRSLNRIRRWLLQCVQMDLAREEHPRGIAHE
jgi:RNA polymerase sigma-70 factor (ECF subfamily)